MLECVSIVLICIIYEELNLKYASLVSYASLPWLSFQIPWNSQKIVYMENKADTLAFQKKFLLLTPGKTQVKI